MRRAAGASDRMREAVDLETPARSATSNSVASGRLLPLETHRRMQPVVRPDVRIRPPRVGVVKRLAAVWVLYRDSLIGAVLASVVARVGLGSEMATTRAD